MLLGAESAGIRFKKERYKSSFSSVRNWRQTKEIARVNKKRYIKFWEANQKYTNQHDEHR